MTLRAASVGIAQPSAAVDFRQEGLPLPRHGGEVDRDAFGPIAQRLEQGTHNPLVAGSNPAGPTNPRLAFRGIPMRATSPDSTSNAPRAPPGKAPRIAKLCFLSILPPMKVRTRNVSLSGELDSQIDRRVKSGRYGNASDVIRAGLRALEREERAEVYRRWLDISDRLPKDPSTPEAEQLVVRLVRASRTRGEQAARKKAAK